MFFFLKKNINYKSAFFLAIYKTFLINIRRNSTYYNGKINFNESFPSQTISKTIFYEIRICLKKQFLKKIFFQNFCVYFVLVSLNS